MRGGGQHRHSPSLPQFESRLYVDCIENIFDCDLVRPVLFNHMTEFLKNGVQLIRHVRMAWEGNATKSYALEFVASIDFDYSIAGTFGAAIDTKDAHRPEFTARSRFDVTLCVN